MNNLIVKHLFAGYKSMMQMQPEKCAKINRFFHGEESTIGKILTDIVVRYLTGIDTDQHICEDWLEDVAEPAGQAIAIEVTYRYDTHLAAPAVNECVEILKEVERYLIIH